MTKNDQNTRILTSKSWDFGHFVHSFMAKCRQKSNAQNGQKWPFWSNQAKSLDSAPGQGAEWKSSPEQAVKHSILSSWPAMAKRLKMLKNTENDQKWPFLVISRSCQKRQKWSKMAKNGHFDHSRLGTDIAGSCQTQ